MTPREKLIKLIALEMQQDFALLKKQWSGRIYTEEDEYLRVAEAIIDYLKIEVIEKKGVKLLPVINIDNLED